MLEYIIHLILNRLFEGRRASRFITAVIRTIGVRII